ncbi:MULTISPECIES: ELWxxDGT repeat protein [Myxococcus]|uniref:ELWxxDGT repeat protein n=1 Tax=Myxococcus TaxID=32 RepID=UPI0011443230|nr:MULTISPECIES: ELWxxDGT repeat protein [Myxococcus]NOK06672.1 HYR domain-containing protein [Myxococcus xanthus]
MKDMGTHQWRPLWLAATLAVFTACTQTESASSEPETVVLGTSSAALSFGTPALVRDLRTRAPEPPTWGPPGSQPAEFVKVGDTLFFTATEASSGLELWKSDGTPEGTQLVRDINPGPASSYITGLTVVGEHVYFSAYEASRGQELWKSDGTPEGTVIVRDIYPGIESSGPSSLRAFNGMLYFGAGNASVNYGLWRSDGTAEGTVPIWGGAPMGFWFNSDLVTVAGTQIFFTVLKEATGNELWRTDGTLEGTRFVRDLLPGSGVSYIEKLWSVGDRVFFVDHAAGQRHLLWTSDGTEEGTRVVYDATPWASPYDAPIKAMAVMGERLYFAALGADDGANVGFELWTSDGNTSWLVKDIDPGEFGSEPAELTAVGNLLYFSAHEGRTGAELWKSDGTEEGTQRVVDLAPGDFVSAYPTGLFGVGNEVYFTARGPSGAGLWRSDGTAEGTVRVKYLHGRVSGTPPEEMLAVGDILYLAATDGTAGVELWRSDGTEAGTYQVKGILVTTADSSPQSLTPFNGGLAFTADVENLGRGPWVTDGTASGTRFLMDTSPTAARSNPAQMLVLNGALVFDALTYANGRELWTSDGTPAGTRLLVDIRPGAGLSSEPQNMTVIGDRLYFAANDGQTGLEPWTSDGTAAGTRLLRDLNPSSASSLPGGFEMFKDRVYFSTRNASIPALATTDGTTDGTAFVRNLTTYLGSTFVAMEDAFLFTAAVTNSNDYELWRSDGTAAGTQLVRNIGEDSHFSMGGSPSYLTMLDGVVYFRAEESMGRHHLWRSDGTTAGTSRVMALPVGQGNFNPRHLTVSNGILFFQAHDPEGGTELWRSDGTTEGTRRVRDIHPGPTGGIAIQPMLALEPEGLVLFTASDGLSGMEPWVSDGTEAGTRRLADIAPGAFSSNPRLFTRAGDTLYFVANDGTTGDELWRVEMDTTPDTTPPTVTCPASLTVEAQADSGTSVSYPPATATDDGFGEPLLSYSHDAGTLFPLGRTAVTVTATDTAGNTATCSFDITVQDTIAPALSCPVDVTVEATSASGATMSYPPATASDAVTSAPQVNYSHPSGTQFPVGGTTVTVTATDAAGNAASCTFVVSVRDNMPPEVTCPANVFAESTSAAGASVSYPPATASDASSPPVTLAYSQASGSFFPFGVTTVTVTATDASGNSAACDFSVTVRDTTAPSLTCPSDVIAEATSAMGATLEYAPAVASDAVTGSPVLVYSQGSGTQFRLGGTEVTVTARDVAGNEATCRFTLTVRDTTSPEVTCPADLTAEAEDASGASLSFTLPSARDTVTAAPEVSSSHAPDSRFPLGMTPVAVMAQDEAGNASSCSFSVTVRDTTPPAIICPADITLRSSGARGATVTFEPATATDTVTASPQVSYSLPSGSDFPRGTTSVVATAVDEAGLSAECTFHVTVRPPATVPATDNELGFGCAAGGTGGVGGAWLLLLGSAVFIQRRHRRA